MQLPPLLEMKEQRSSCSFLCVRACSQHAGNCSKTQMLEPLKALTILSPFFKGKQILKGTQNLHSFNQSKGNIFYQC